MLNFQSIKEFIDAFWRESQLMVELFDKRNLRVRYDDALQLVGEKEESLEFLIQRSVIIKNGEFIELDSRYLEFFEDILDVNSKSIFPIYKKILKILKQILISILMKVINPGSSNICVK
ncbi:MAG: hypothetical protein IPG89_18385 [Bacteroidetes bacterium]|nr:hypothetical protein [Bacteroidota bacterium]